MSSAGDLADLNARQLAAIQTTDVHALADDLRTSLAEVARLITGFGDRQPVFTCPRRGTRCACADRVGTGSPSTMGG